MLFSVMLGGALGALSRYLINVVMQHPSFPFVTEKLSYATFTVNILGSFFLAFIVFGFGDNWRPELKLAITTGFLGSFTTFSTFEVQKFVDILGIFFSFLEICNDET